MQKFNEKFQNAPTDTPLVRRSATGALNRDQSLSVRRTVLSLNNLEEDQRCCATGWGLRVPSVPVLNISGLPLMPTTPRKANKLLKQQKAIIVKRSPFVIQLTIATGEQKQPLTLGVDTGFEYVGVSVISEKREVLSATYKLRTDISDKMTERAMYRRGRRNKLWYREPRWENRGRSNGWSAPSVRQKIDSHVQIINNICKLLPVTKIIIECAKFDIQKINNLDIKGAEYQNGRQREYENVKSYVLARDGYECQSGLKGCCDKLHVHHKTFRSQGGTDNPDNLVTLCEKHHGQLHAGKIDLKFNKPKQFKAETIMSIIRKRVLGCFGDAIETFGYETKSKRHELGLEKSHSTDAFVIAGGVDQRRSLEYIVVQKRRNNRCLQLNRKGFKPSIRRQRYKIQPKDIIWVGDKKYIVKGSCNYGNKISVIGEEKPLYFSVKKIMKHFNSKSYIWAVNGGRIFGLAQSANDLAYC